jgi:hypothetical protein
MLVHSFPLSSGEGAPQGRERCGGEIWTRLHPSSPALGQWKQRSMITAQGGGIKEDGEEYSAPAPSLLQL